MSNLFLIFSENLKNTPIINKTALEEYKQKNQMDPTFVLETDKTVKVATEEKAVEEAAQAKISKEAQAKAVEEAQAKAVEAQAKAVEAQAKAVEEAKEEAKEASTAQANNMFIHSMSSVKGIKSSNHQRVEKDDKNQNPDLNQMMHTNYTNDHSQTNNHNKKHFTQLIKNSLIEGGSSTVQTKKKHVTSNDIMKVFTKMLEIINEKKNNS